MLELKDLSFSMTGHWICLPQEGVAVHSIRYYVANNPIVRSDRSTWMALRRQVASSRKRMPKDVHNSGGWMARRYIADLHPLSFSFFSYRFQLSSLLFIVPSSTIITHIVYDYNVLGDDIARFLRKGFIKCLWYWKV